MGCMAQRALGCFEYPELSEAGGSWGSRVCVISSVPWKTPHGLRVEEKYFVGMGVRSQALQNGVVALHHIM